MEHFFALLFLPANLFSTDGLIVSILAALAVTVLTYGVIYSLNPKLIAKDAYIVNEKIIKVKVINDGCFDAVNVRIEICAYDTQGKFTYHLLPDHKDFLIIPSKKRRRDNEKVFNACQLMPSCNTVGIATSEVFESLKSGSFKLRVRIHSYHEFSGLGKADEFLFDKLPSK